MTESNQNQGGQQAQQPGQKPGRADSKVVDSRSLISSNSSRGRSPDRAASKAARRSNAHLRR